MFLKIILLVTAIVTDVTAYDWNKALLDISELLIFLAQPAQRAAKMAAGDPDEAILRTFGPTEVVARQKTNRSFRAAYGIMCATGLQRYGLHSKNSSHFNGPQSDSGTADAVSSPDLPSLS